MRIEDTDERERLWEMLEECSNQNTKSKAVEDAARYYCRLRGARGYNSTIDELMSKAIDKGSLSAEEIAEIIDERELPVEYEPAEFSVGE